MCCGATEFRSRTIRPHDRCGQGEDGETVQGSLQAARSEVARSVAGSAGGLGRRFLGSVWRAGQAGPAPWVAV
jgi:hypothetical protein